MNMYERRKKLQQQHEAIHRASRFAWQQPSIKEHTPFSLTRFRRLPRINREPACCVPCC